MKNAIDGVSEILGRPGTFDEKAQAVCSFLRKNVPHYPWVGIYMLGPDGMLELRAWDGPAATQHTRIPLGEGICGLAAREARTVLVDDVSKDPRYLECFLSTKSEIVVPIFREGQVIGEIDVDGSQVAAFNQADRILLEWIALGLGRQVPG